MHTFKIKTPFFGEKILEFAEIEKVVAKLVTEVEYLANNGWDLQAEIETPTTIHQEWSNNLTTCVIDIEFDCCTGCNAYLIDGQVQHELFCTKVGQNV